MGNWEWYCGQLPWICNKNDVEEDNLNTDEGDNNQDIESEIFFDITKYKISKLKSINKKIEEIGWGNLKKETDYNCSNL